jgi:imidazolonepropionase-like amidohydrolase
MKRTKVDTSTTPQSLRFVCISSCLAALSLCCAPVAGSDLRIDHVTIVSPERSRPMQEATVYIQRDRIVSISRSSSGSARGLDNTLEVIDGKGLFLAPGLIDSHVHTSLVPGLTLAQQQDHPDLTRAALDQIPRSYLYFGFTTLIDLVSAPEQIVAWNAHDPHPDLYFCGGAPIVDGYPMNWPPKPDRYQQFPYMLVQRGEETAAPEGIDASAHTPDAVIARMKADGAICAKSFFDRGGNENLPVPPLETIRALVRAAHATNMPVLLHAYTSEAQTFALDAGVDIIAHGLWDWNGEPPMTSELTPSIKKILDRVIAAKVGWQPTMQVAYGFRDLFDPAYLSDPRMQRVIPASLIAWYRSPEGQWFHDRMATGLLSKELAASANVAAQWKFVLGYYATTIARNRSASRYLAERNARILFGTDTPAAAMYTNPPGLNGWLEMQRLIDAGLTPAQVFRAATLSNAQALGLSREVGTVQAGKRANLLLLRKNPAQTIQAYDEIVKVILHGRVLDRSELAANRATKQ